MKYPPHLYTIEVHFGPETIFKEHYVDAEKAGMVLKDLKVRMFGSNGQMTGLKMYHQGRLISQYLPTPPKPKWTYVPPAPDLNGVRKIPTGVSGLKKTSVVVKPIKRLPPEEPAPDLVDI
jgi:hypothetical protein